LTAAALGFGDKEALPEAKPVYLALDVLPAETRHSQDDPVLGKQMTSQLRSTALCRCIASVNPSSSVLRFQVWLAFGPRADANL
jgi:hypothetical protein